ncbi:MAG: nuclear transport factor 2 family protein [Lachnospiraceae bacterium]|nr:nuclear transport factor 2 family protein [Lachnospiraceae bacterium]
MNDEEEIKGLYRKYWQCMIEKDADGLRSLMSKDYYLMHMTGVKQSVSEFINGLMNGTFNYYSVEHDSIDVNITGNTATMIGKSRVVAAVYGGGKNKWRLQGDFTLRKENGNWKLTSSKASTY